MQITTGQPFSADRRADHTEPMSPSAARRGPGGAARRAPDRSSARHLHIGWVIVWPAQYQVFGYHPTPQILDYLTATGFRLDYHADGALVYRPTG